MSDKTFDVLAAQQDRHDFAIGFVGGIYQHYKGALYFVRAVSVHEATGQLLITYESISPGSRQGWLWSRTLADFTSDVITGPRFKRVGSLSDAERTR